jgi:hypothetical protein
MFREPKWPIQRRTDQGQSNELTEAACFGNKPVIRELQTPYGRGWARAIDHTLYEPGQFTVGFSLSRARLPRSLRSGGLGAFWKWLEFVISLQALPTLHLSTL